MTIYCQVNDERDDVVDTTTGRWHNFPDFMKSQGLVWQLCRS